MFFWVLFFFKQRCKSSGGAANVYLLVLTIGVGNTHISLHPYGARD